MCCHHFYSTLMVVLASAIGEKKKLKSYALEGWHKAVPNDMTVRIENPKAFH